MKLSFAPILLAFSATASVMAHRASVLRARDSDLIAREYVEALHLAERMLYYDDPSPRNTGPFVDRLDSRASGANGSGFYPAKQSDKNNAKAFMKSVSKDTLQIAASPGDSAKTKAKGYGMHLDRQSSKNKDGSHTVAVQKNDRGKNAFSTVGQVKIREGQKATDTKVRKAMNWSINNGKEAAIKGKDAKWRKGVADAEKAARNAAAKKGQEKAASQMQKNPGWTRSERRQDRKKEVKAAKKAARKESLAASGTVVKSKARR